MVRSEPALASLTASSEIRSLMAPICTSAFGLPSRLSDLGLELLARSCYALAIEPLPLR